MFRAPRAALAAVLLIGLAACGDDDAEPVATAAPTTVAPTTVAPVTTAPDESLRIVSLSPTHTEILFAIGADDLVIAVDDQSNFPAEALEKPHDLSGFQPNVEAIAALEPDLVVVGGDFNDLTGQLAPLGIEVWSGDAPSTFDDVYAQIEQLGAITGRVAEAAELVLQMQTDIDAIVTEANLGASGEQFTYYHELDPTFYSVTSNTFIGQVYGLFGLRSIADGVQEGNDYPQLSAEYVVSAQPDLVFLADTKCCGESAESVAARPGWEAIPAVAAGRVVALDDDIASRWGPRLVEFVRQVADAVVAARVPAG